MANIDARAFDEQFSDRDLGTEIDPGARFMAQAPKTDPDYGSEEATRMSNIDSFAAMERQRRGAQQPLPGQPPADERTRAVNIRGDVPGAYASSEIDLRGMRVGEVEDIVMHAVDNAVRADVKAIRIIHGKGTGALRERISEMLQKEPRVTNFRLAAWNEGGAGVTVVELA